MVDKKEEEYCERYSNILNQKNENINKKETFIKKKLDSPTFTKDYDLMYQKNRTAFLHDYKRSAFFKKKKIIENASKEMLNALYEIETNEKVRNIIAKKLQ